MLESLIQMMSFSETHIEPQTSFFLLFFCQIILNLVCDRPALNIFATEVKFFGTSYGEKCKNIQIRDAHYGLVNNILKTHVRHNISTVKSLKFKNKSKLHNKKWKYCTKNPKVLKLTY